MATKLLFSTALAGLLISAGAAMAQPQDHHGRGASNHGAAQSHAQRGDHDRGDRSRGSSQVAQAATPKAGDPGTPKYQNFWGPGNERSNNNQAGNRASQAPAASNGNNNNFRRGDDNRRPDSRNNGSNDRRDYGNRNDRQNYDRGRGRPDFSQYHRNFRSAHRFRGPTYHRPRGWYAHRWTFGEILPSLFWTNDYWLNDYYAYGLQSPPPGTVWVRDGGDALLIDRFDGQIIQVVYDVFY